ncbi:MAG TPA: TldD/PmbA family protein [Chloroflexia bacterium]|nr:TldD/PmbA family protein [Chloroflexia bacterium]
MDDTLPAGPDRDALEAALAASPAEQTEIVLVRDRTAVTRYANSEIHQNVYQENTRAAIRVAAGGATARIYTNDISRDGLARATADATALARLQAPNPRFRSLPAPDSGSRPAHAAPPSFFPATAEFSAAARAAAVGQVIDLARAAGYQAYGTYRSSSTTLSVANSLGIRAHAAATTAYLKALVESAAGTGFADALSRDVAAVDPQAVGADAVARCRLNHDQREVPPGDYPAVFEPNAVADMVRFPVLYGLGAREYQDGQSFLSGHLGTAVTGPAVTLWDDPRDPRCLPFAIDAEGLPSVRVPLIAAGVAEGVVYDSETAALEPDRRSTGHAPNPFEHEAPGHPVPGHIIMPTGPDSSLDLARRMGRGILVTRFHYTHCPDRKRVIATGTTRDGTFLVEGGEIVAALKNLRLEMSVLDLLAGTDARGQGKCCQDWWAANGMGSTVYYLPALLFARATFIGVTTF